MLSEDPNEAIDDDFFRRRIGEAIDLRRNILKLDEVTDAYRVVHSEGDGLSGLVVDRFGSLLVIAYFSAGMWKQRDLVRRILKLTSVPRLRISSIDSIEADPVLIEAIATIERERRSSGPPG